MDSLAGLLADSRKVLGIVLRSHLRATRVPSTPASTIATTPFVSTLAIAILFGLAIPSSKALAEEAGAVTSSSDAKAGTTQSADAPAPASKPVCVDVEVSGKRTLSYGCLSDQLALHAAKPNAASQSAAEALATQPSNKVGTFNLSAEETRFGNAWGKSTTPQRPAPPVFVRP